MGSIADGWESIGRNISLQVEALEDGRQILIEVDVPTQAVKRWWIARSFLPCPTCGSYVVFDGAEVLSVIGESITFQCEKEDRWNVEFEELGEGDPPARGSRDL